MRHDGGIVWLTGLPGAGKSTIATGAAEALKAEGYRAYVLDGDVLRRGLNADLGFSAADRDENVRRVGEVACLFADAGILSVVALISPYARGRGQVRERAGRRFHEVYVKAPVEICARRDPKGLYAKARGGELPGLTGVSAPYEPPQRPELTIETSAEPQEASVARLIAYIHEHFPTGPHACPE